MDEVLQQQNPSLERKRPLSKRNILMGEPKNHLLMAGGGPKKNLIIQNYK